MSKGGRIVWMDLEMTGLDPERERIIEVAVLVTDSDLEVIAEGPNLVIHQSEELLNGMDAWNQEHHGASGLIERVRQSNVSEADAAELVLAFIKEHTLQKKSPLAGNSIYQDRRFLVRYMPEVEDWLHYRLVDVSTIKELCARWYPDAYGKRPRKRGHHRAMDDIRESIEELKFYREHVFAPIQK